MSDHMELTEQYQTELLAAAWTNPTSFSRTRKAINGESKVFSNPHVQWLFDLAANTLDTSAELPSPGLVAQEASLSFKGEEYGDLILAHAEVMNKKPSSPNALIGRAVELGEMYRFKETTKRVDKLVSNGKYHEAKALMEARPWVIETTKLSRFRERRMNHGYDDVDKFIENAKARRDDPGGFRISTGILELDARMDGGPALGDMTLLIGWTGRGKSTLAVNLVDSALRQGKGGLFLPSEMRDELITAKIFARSLHMKQNDVYIYRFDSQQERDFLAAIEARRERFNRLLMVEQLGTESMDREGILRAIDDAAEYLRDFSWIVVDTLDHCQLLPEFKHNPVRGFGSNANWISGVTDDINVASIVTTQANRQGSDRTELQHAANHSEGIRVSQNVISVNHADITDKPDNLDPEDDFEELMKPPSVNGSVVLSLLKCRLGEPGDVHITTDLARSYMGDKIIDAYDELGRFDEIKDQPIMEAK